MPVRGLMLMRTFLAFKLPRVVIREVDLIQNRLPYLEGLNIVPAEDNYMIVRFVGETEEVSELKRLGHDIAVRSEPICGLSLGSVEAYPDLQWPRSIYINVERPSPTPDTLDQLRSEIEEGLVDLGITAPEEFQYLPHITIARIEASVCPARRIRFFVEAFLSGGMANRSGGMANRLRFDLDQLTLFCSSTPPNWHEERVYAPVFTARLGATRGRETR